MSLTPQNISMVRNMDKIVIGEVDFLYQRTLSKTDKILIGEAREPDYSKRVETQGQNNRHPQKPMFN